jgi:hypothetical protein
MAIFQHRAGASGVTATHFLAAIGVLALAAGCAAEGEATPPESTPPPPQMMGEPSIEAGPGVHPTSDGAATEVVPMMTTEDAAPTIGNDASPVVDAAGMSTDASGGYPLNYDQPFSSPASLADMVFSNPNGWRYETVDGGLGALSLFQNGGYSPPYRSPTGIALFALRQFGSFVMEVDAMQTGADYGHRDVCLFFGFKDPSHFYYAHIATAPDAVSHQIHIVNNADRTAITLTRSNGYDWGRNVWRHLRLVRDIDTGVIEVYAEGGMPNPVLTANDKTFGMGYIGLGSFDDVARFRNLRVYSANTLDGRPNFFTAKP